MKKLLLVLSAMLIANAVFAYPVMYNTSSGKYHQLWCKWAKKCSVNCIKIDHKEAIKRGGVPCKVCGG